jgi:hypothetical protein
MGANPRNPCLAYYFSGPFPIRILSPAGIGALPHLRRRNIGNGALGRHASPPMAERSQYRIWRLGPPSVL